MISTKISSQALLEQAKTYANEFIKDINQSVTAYHFVEMGIKKLEEKEFVRLYERDQWNLEAGKKYFFTRNNSCLIAFTVGSKFSPSTGCFKIIGGHTDSPSLRLAPNAYNPSGELERYNLQTYGGGLWNTWFDRMLSVAGKVVIRNDKGELDTKIIRINKPIMFIPSLPPHLTNERNKFEWNNENHLKAIMMTHYLKTDKEESDPHAKKLGVELTKVICKAIDTNMKSENLIDYDLILYDTQESCLMGAKDEFISSGRMDNLGTSIPAVSSLIESSSEMSQQSSINIIALFDNEEIGSMTYQGADSNFFLMSLMRIFKSFKGENIDNYFLSFCSRSFVISADLAHAFNPNYSEKYQSNHLCHCQGGVVVKTNANGRYSSDSESVALIKELAIKCNIPIQEMIVRQDSPCGSTIGPIIAGKIGIKSVDIGIPQFAMHSIRETLGICDLYSYKLLFNEFFKSYENVVGKLFQK